MQKEKEEQIKVVYTAGGLDVADVLFEQVEDGQFALWDLEGNITHERQHSYGFNYQPLDKAPWKLCKTPIEYKDTEELWTEIWQFIYDHLFLPDKALYDVLTAWVIATWTPEVWTVVPYVFFFGAVASGKTRGLEVLHRLAYRGIISSNISSAALYRACEMWHPTLILDETEIYNKTERHDVIGLLNSGYRKGQYAVRVKNTEHGCELEVFDVFGFKAMAGTEGLAQTLESRSVIIRMIKNRRKVKLFIDEERANQIRAKLLMYRMKILNFATRNTASDVENRTVERDLCDLRDSLLEGIPSMKVESGRLQELFQPLLAVSNHGRENIVRYAEKMEEIQRFEEKASEEAEIVEILLNASMSLENGTVLTSNVTDAFNKSRSEREKWKSSSVGRLMRRLGFQKRHTRSGKGWHVDPERLKYLKEIYLGDNGEQSETPQTSLPLAEKGSQRSQGSHGTMDSHTVGRDLCDPCDPFLAKGHTPSEEENVTFICCVCHEEFPLSYQSSKLGRPTCKRCAGEEVEG
jgi:hypothetical protein